MDSLADLEGCLPEALGFSIGRQIPSQAVDYGNLDPKNGFSNCQVHHCLHIAAGNGHSLHSSSYDSLT